MILKQQCKSTMFAQKFSGYDVEEGSIAIEIFLACHYLFIDFGRYREGFDDAYVDDVR